MPESYRLFLVEDDENIAFLMRRYLERAGYQVTHCRSGSDALIVLQNQQFHLVILDNKLPDMPGLELLKTLNREGIATPVLFITGYGDQLLAADVLRAGALDYVVKDNDRQFLPELPKRVRESVLRYRLQQTNRLLIAALESARDGVIVTDLHGIVVHVNQALETMLGTCRDVILGRHYYEILREENSAHPLKDLWSQVLEEGGWQGDLSVKRSDGSLVDISLTCSPIFGDRNQRTNFVIILRDVGDQKKMERQLVQAQKMQSVGTLAGGVAHEFNNLLAGVQGYASLALRDTQLAPLTREFLQNVVQLADRAAHLTRQLLAFARKPALSRMPTHVDYLLFSTRDLVQRTLNVQVDVEIGSVPPSNPRWNLTIDGNQLQQVLVNLTLNARDAMNKPAKTPIVYRLTQQVLSETKPAFPQPVPAGEYVLIQVIDRGNGMTPEILQQSVDPFFTTKDVGEGTGLGLSVVFGIMTGHQGYLTIESEAGVGTKVGLYLSAEPAFPAVEMDSAPTLTNETIPLLGHRVLVVDDEPSVQDVIRRFLEIAGHEITAVSSGRAAMERLDAGEEIDLIILDLMIPKEEGFANYRQIRRLRPEVPILLCTGLVQNEQASQLLGEGATELLRKPFRMHDLWEAVDRCTRKPILQTSQV